MTEKASVRWTLEQLAAIETRDKNMLVSAAAGSGKTAVLVQRIKQLILQDKVEVDRFLITTFTNAASAEMKERLEKTIREELERPQADKAYLKRQLSMIPRANISTFHTFALEIMRRFFYVTDLEPGFRIGDDIEVSILKQQAADELFRQRFDEDYDSFGRFLTKYSSDRSDKKIKANIISLYDEMRSIPHYMRWAYERTELLREVSPSKALGLTAFIAAECRRRLEEAAEEFEQAAALLESCGIESLCTKAWQDAEKVREAAERMADSGKECFVEYRDFYDGLKFNQMRAVKAEQEDYDAIKEQVSACRQNGKKLLEDLSRKYFQRSLEEYDEELRVNYEDTLYLAGLLESLEHIFKEKKREKNIVDFDDVMHYALEILEDDMVSAEYRKRFRYIFIDEFQDSNMLQEAITVRIAGENNLFMVGDVKQSIYKFRLAEPEIFRQKYVQYAKEEDRDSINIDLSSNFRSKRSVTETVNRVFHAIMEDYDEKAMLHCTIDENYPGIRSSLHIIETGKSEEELPENPQLEARQVWEIIKQRLGQEIFDVKKGVMRPLEYRDIAVLSRSRSMIGELERFLNDAGVPAYGENTGGYFETVEIQVFINMLKVLDNSRQDIPLISVMRSPFFDFDVKELAAIRIFHREGAYHEAVRHYAEEGSDEELRNKTGRMLEQISFWKKLKTSVSLEELVRVLMYDTGYFDYCSGLPAGKQRISNLRLLLEKAERFRQTDHSGLYGFLTYIEAMKENRLTMGEAKMLGENENVVRIMTVHKSKGLEFPLVILAGAGRMIKPKGMGSSASMHKELAIGLPYVDIDQKWHRRTLLQRVIEGKKAAEELEEEIRILYVAMTRAMDGIAVTGVIKDVEKLQQGEGRRRSYMDMLYAPMEAQGDDIFFCSPDGAGQQEGQAAASRLRMAEIFAKCREARDEEKIRRIDERLSFRYPDDGSTAVKSKYSVTELNKGEERSISLIQPEFSGEKAGLTAAEIGTAMHLVMEKLDFRKAVEEGREYIEEVIETLSANERLSREETASLVPEDMAAFFTQNVGRRAAMSDTLEKEREFIFEMQKDGSSTIVQGIIDCYFEEEDGIVLIDYKNSYVGSGTSEADIAERYRGQMELYRMALEEALGKKVREAYLYLFKQHKFLKLD